VRGPPLQRAVVRTPLPTTTSPATPLQVESIAELEGGGNGDGESGGGTFPFYFPAAERFAGGREVIRGR